MSRSKHSNNNRYRQNNDNRSNKRNVVILIILIVIAAVLSVVVWNSKKADPETGPDTTMEEPEDIDGNDDSPISTGDADHLTDEPGPAYDQLAGVESVNPLTGEPMDLARAANRPLAIVMANTADALPMNGVSDADIIYEVLVEGGITRMLALFQDFTHVEKAGSIRSARHYTVEIAASYDAIYISAGGSPQAFAEIRSSGIPHLNEVEGPRREIFFRDRNRISGQRLESLHSVVTTGERVVQWLPFYDFRLNHEDGYVRALDFAEDGTPAGGANATRIVVSFSSKTTTFNYNADKNVYNLYQFNRDFIDANDNSKPDFTNVLVLKTRTAPIPGDDSGRITMETTGTGEGFFACGGKYIEIIWSRDNKTSQFTYTHRDGTPLELGVGKTFICIIPTTMDASFS